MSYTEQELTNVLKEFEVLIVTSKNLSEREAVEFLLRRGIEIARETPKQNLATNLSSAINARLEDARVALSSLPMDADDSNIRQHVRVRAEIATCEWLLVTLSQLTKLMVIALGRVR